MVIRCKYVKKSGCNKFHLIPEIGAVLFDVTRNGSVAEFRSYVRPTRFPQLSDRYQRTFGISQVVIEPQRRLKEVLEEFSEWVDDIEFRYDIELIPAPCWYEYPGGAYMCTWSSNDLRHILRKELAEKYLEYPEYFKCWFDIQKVVKVRARRSIAVSEIYPDSFRIFAHCRNTIHACPAINFFRLHKVWALRPSAMRTRLWTMRMYWLASHRNCGRTTFENMLWTAFRADRAMCVARWIGHSLLLQLYIYLFYILIHLHAFCCFQ